MPDDVHVVLDESAIRDLSASDEMRDALMDIADPVVLTARALAPKRSGRGAESIRAEPVFDSADREWTVRISWTRDHYYLYFHDHGTRQLPAREFLEAALRKATT